jgi:hypothetical protein
MGMVITYPSDRTRPMPRTISAGPGKSGLPLSLGIIGAGNHVKDMLLPPLQAMDSVSIRVICTASGLTAKTVVDKIQGASCTSDLQAILDDSAINTVLISTRHDSHAALVVKSLLADKHVFVEKPLCLTEENCKTFAPHTRRKHPADFTDGRIQPAVFSQRQTGPIVLFLASQSARHALPHQCRMNPSRALGAGSGGRRWAPDRGSLPFCRLHASPLRRASHLGLRGTHRTP